MRFKVFSKGAETVGGVDTGVRESTGVEAREWISEETWDLRVEFALLRSAKLTSEGAILGVSGTWLLELLGLGKEALSRPLWDRL